MKFPMFVQPSPQPPLQNRGRARWRKTSPQAGGIPANVLQGFDKAGPAFQQRNMLNTLTAAVNPSAVLSGVAANEKKQVAELD